MNKQKSLDKQYKQWKILELKREIFPSGIRNKAKDGNKAKGVNIGG